MLDDKNFVAIDVPTYNGDNYKEFREALINNDPYAFNRISAYLGELKRLYAPAPGVKLPEAKYAQDAFKTKEKSTLADDYAISQALNDRSITNAYTE